MVHPPFAASLHGGAVGSSAATLFEAPNTQVLLAQLEQPQTMFLSNARAQRDKLLLKTLAAAYRDMKILEGHDAAQWTRGKLHHNLSEHAFSPAVDEVVRRRLNVGPFETGGSAYTVNASPYRTSDFQQSSGPSVRIVLDVGNWDNSRAVNYAGSVGQPRQPALP